VRPATEVWQSGCAANRAATLIDVQRAEARRRPLHHGRVDLGDLDVERGDPTTDGRFVVQLLDRGELPLHLAEQLIREGTGCLGQHEHERLGSAGVHTAESQQTIDSVGNEGPGAATGRSRSES
jgi:hypothetical protein